MCPPSIIPLAQILASERSNRGLYNSAMTTRAQCLYSAWQVCGEPVTNIYATCDSARLPTKDIRNRVLAITNWAPVRCV